MVPVNLNLPILLGTVYFSQKIKNKKSSVLIDYTTIKKKKKVVYF